MYTGPRGNNSTGRAQGHGQSRCEKQREKEAKEKRSQSDLSAPAACDGLQTNSATGAALLRTNKTIRAEGSRTGSPGRRSDAISKIARGNYLHLQLRI